MTEKDFVIAWMLAAKNGSGIATAWKEPTMEFQLQEAKKVYRFLEQQMPQPKEHHHE